MSIAVWRDRKGRVSPLRVATLAALFWPALLALGTALTSGLGARPLNDLIHRSGYWALIFFLVTLAVTPLRRASRYGALVDVRRMLGVGAFVYAFTHFGLYVIDQGFDLVRVAAEIVRRLYLTIGFVALAGFAVLAATSTDASVKRIGGLRWRRLHQASYALVLLAIVHFFQQTKADLTIPTLFAGLFAWLMGYRVLAARLGADALSPLWLAALAIAVGAATLIGEAVGIGLAFGVSPMTVLATAIDFDLGIRPGWSVMASGLAVAALDALRTWQRGGSAPSTVRRAAAPR